MFARGAFTLQTLYQVASEAAASPEEGPSEALRTCLRLSCTQRVLDGAGHAASVTDANRVTGTQRQQRTGLAFAAPAWHVGLGSPAGLVIAQARELGAWRSTPRHGPPACEAKTSLQCCGREPLALMAGRMVKAGRGSAPTPSMSKSRARCAGLRL